MLRTVELSHEVIVDVDRSRARGRDPVLDDEQRRGVQRRCRRSTHRRSSHWSVQSRRRAPESFANGPAPEGWLRTRSREILGTRHAATCRREGRLPTARPTTPGDRGRSGPRVPEGDRQGPATRREQRGRARDADRSRQRGCGVPGERGPVLRPAGTGEAALGGVRRAAGEGRADRGEPASGGLDRQALPQPGASRSWT